MADTFTWALFGTSLSHGATRGRSYAGDVTASLCVGKASRVSHLNLSIDGGTSLAATTEKLLTVAATKPDAFVIEFSMNDCAVGTVAQSRARHEQIIYSIRAAQPGAQIFLMTMNGLLGASAPVTSRTSLSLHYQMYRDLAAAEGVGLIDNAPQWVGATLADMPDGMHPTIAAHRARTVPGIVAALAGLVT